MDNIIKVIKHIDVKVKEFNKPLNHTKEDIGLIGKLLEEELDETAKANHYTGCETSIEKVKQLSEYIDGLSDITYVLWNYLYLLKKYDYKYILDNLWDEDSEISRAAWYISGEINTPFLAVFDSVHESNMSKFIDGKPQLNLPEYEWYDDSLPLGKVLKTEAQRLGTFKPMSVEKLLYPYVTYCNHPYNETGEFIVPIGDNLVDLNKVTKEVDSLSPEDLINIITAYIEV